MKVLVKYGRDLKGATRKFLQRAIRACLRRANPLTSLLLVSELNQSFYGGLACASRASEIRSLPRGGRILCEANGLTVRGLLQTGM